MHVAIVQDFCVNSKLKLGILTYTIIDYNQLYILTNTERN